MSVPECRSRRKIYPLAGLLRLHEGEKWIERLKEEYMVLIEYIKMNKEEDSDWFTIESNQEGTDWNGKCWLVHNLVKYEFDLHFAIPAAYP